MQTKEYECPNCGGSVIFDSKAQDMVCEYCKTHYSVEEFEKLMNEQYKAEPEEEISWEESNKEFSENEGKKLTVYSCQSCGGEILADEATIATSCPFCNNNVVIPSQLEGDLRPEIVIPFKLSREDAKNALKNFYKNKPLLPKVFTNENHIDEIKGVYIPFWLYSGRAYTNINFDAYKINMWSDSHYDYIERRKYAVHREGNVDFEDVPVDASSKVEDMLMESIEPFDWKSARDFKIEYLAGFLANRYDLTKEECIDNAKNRIKNTAISSMTDSVTGYQEVKRRNLRYNLKEGKITYALAPVWMLVTDWKNHKYTFAINAQNGNIAGDELPVDGNLAKE